MPSIRGLIDDAKSALQEDQTTVAIVGALLGAGAATLAERYGPGPDPDSFAITVDQARASLLSMLALVFTGLSIVLALTALATGNMASKFSPRLLGMKLRTRGTKWMLSVFATTAAFIITSQVLIRSRDGAELAPPLMMSVGVLMLVITGVVIVWYIDGTLQSLRVDRTIRWIGRRIGRAVKAQERQARHDIIADTIDLERPADAIDLLAPEDGYVVAVDTGRLEHVAANGSRCIVLERGTGCPVVRGEAIGWLSAPTSRGEDGSAEILDCLTIANARHADTDVGYTVDVLVDIGLMALSPAVNDPRTAVECTEMLTVVCTDLARRKVGNRTRVRQDGSPSVVVIGATMGDYLDTAGRQILQFGSGVPMVTAALLRLGRQGERAARSDRDRKLCKRFANDVDAVKL